MAPRTASYSIDATLDASARTLTGREVITWRTPGGKPAYSIRLHLYWNAWRNTDSTWLSQRTLSGLGADDLQRPAADFGWQQVTELRLVNPDGTPGADLLPGFRYIQPVDQPWTFDPDRVPAAIRSELGVRDRSPALTSSPGDSHAR